MFDSVKDAVSKVIFGSGYGNPNDPPAKDLGDPFADPSDVDPQSDRPTPKPSSTEPRPKSAAKRSNIQPITIGGEPNFEHMIPTMWAAYWLLRNGENRKFHRYLYQYREDLIKEGGMSMADADKIISEQRQDGSLTYGIFYVDGKGEPLFTPDVPDDTASMMMRDLDDLKKDLPSEADAASTQIDAEYIRGMLDDMDDDEKQAFFMAVPQGQINDIKKILTTEEKKLLYAAVVKRMSAEPASSE